MEPLSVCSASFIPQQNGIDQESKPAKQGPFPPKEALLNHLFLLGYIDEQGKVINNFFPPSLSEDTRKAVEKILNRKFKLNNFNKSVSLKEIHKTSNEMFFEGMCVLSILKPTFFLDALKTISDDLPFGSSLEEELQHFLNFIKPHSIKARIMVKDRKSLEDAFGDIVDRIAIAVDVSRDKVLKEGFYTKGIAKNTSPEQYAILSLGDPFRLHLMPTVTLPRRFPTSFESLSISCKDLQVASGGSQAIIDIACFIARFYEPYQDTDWNLLMLSYMMGLRCVDPEIEKTLFNTLKSSNTPIELHVTSYINKFLKDDPAACAAFIFNNIITLQKYLKSEELVSIIKMLKPLVPSQNNYIYDLLKILFDNDISLLQVELFILSNATDKSSEVEYHIRAGLHGDLYFEITIRANKKLYRLRVPYDVPSAVKVLINISLKDNAFHQFYRNKLSKLKISPHSQLEIPEQELFDILEGTSDIEAKHLVLLLLMVSQSKSPTMLFHAYDVLSVDGTLLENLSTIFNLPKMQPHEYLKNLLTHPDNKIASEGMKIWEKNRGTLKIEMLVKAALLHHIDIAINMLLKGDEEDRKALFSLCWQTVARGQTQYTTRLLTLAETLDLKDLKPQEIAWLGVHSSDQRYVDYFLKNPYIQTNSLVTSEENAAFLSRVLKAKIEQKSLDHCVRILTSMLKDTSNLKPLATQLFDALLENNKSKEAYEILKLKIFDDNTEQLINLIDRIINSSEEYAGEIICYLFDSENTAYSILSDHRFQFNRSLSDGIPMTPKFRSDVTSDAFPMANSPGLLVYC